MASIQLPMIQADDPFPSVDLAKFEPDGLLAFGGDLSTERLVKAYRSGIFPWFSEGDPILWWSPSVRSIIIPSKFHVSRSLKKTLKKDIFSLSINTAFNNVIEYCSAVPRYQDGAMSEGTWITQEMKNAYIRLHHAGYAHSIEVWNNNRLVGGLYGVVTDNIFCGESMFHTMTNASKAAMTALASLLRTYPNAFIDCQMPTDHLMSLGAQSIERTSFITKMTTANQTALPSTLWIPRELVLCLD